MAQQCPASVEPLVMTDCSDDCATRFFEHREQYFDEDTGFFCTAVRNYRWDTCEVGVGVGRHAFSITLLPGEEVELEEVRRDKFSRSLHDARTTTSELEETVEIMAMEEMSTKGQYEYELSGEGKFGLFGQKVKGRRAYNDSVETLHRTMLDVTLKAAARVSEKNEVVVDIKSEAENVYRSTRKVRNPNPCQPITYHFRQLVRRVRRRLTLVDVLIRCSPPAGDETPRPSGANFRTAIAREAPRSLDVVAAPPGAETTAVGCPADAEAAKAPSSRRVEFAAAPEIEATRAELVETTRLREGDEAARRVDAAVAPVFDLAEPNDGGLIFEEELCIATAGFHVDGVVSECAVCEDTELARKSLEVDRLKLELEKLKCEVELCREKKDDGKEDEKRRPSKGGIDPI